VPSDASPETALFNFADIVVGSPGLALLIEQANFSIAYIVMAALLGLSVYAFTKRRVVIRAQAS
jgi:hypothetical protein